MIGWFYLVANHRLSESQVVVSANCLFGEKSVRQTVGSTKCSFDKMSFGKMSGQFLSSCKDVAMPSALHVSVNYYYFLKLGMTSVIDNYLLCSFLKDLTVDKSYQLQLFQVQSLTEVFCNSKIDSYLLYSFL